MRIFLIIFAFTLVAVVSIAGFRGQRTKDTPIYIFNDMDRQQRFHPQGENTLFDNRMDDRLPIGGTVARGNELELASVFSEDYSNTLVENPHFVTGKDESGEYLRDIPIPVSYELMELGREKYDVFCKVCHGGLGEGNGVTLAYGVNASNLLTPVYLERPDGNLYETITYGYNTMMGYGDKLSVEERWAVVLYLRALQKSFNATEADLSPAQKQELGL